MLRIGDIPPWEMNERMNAAAFARAAKREAKKREEARRERKAKSALLAIPKNMRRRRRETPKFGRLPLTGNEQRDLCGKQCGYVTALEPIFRLRTKHSQMTYWRCRCELCGRLFDTQRQALVCRSIRSCGGRGCKSKARKETLERKKTGAFTAILAAGE